MAHIDINLNEVPDQGEAHPDGQTHVRIKKGELLENKAKDGKHIRWQLEVVGSENHMPLWLRTSLKKDALWNLKAFLQKAGVQWQTDGSFDIEDALGAELYVEVGRDVGDDGTTRNEVGPPYNELAF